MSKEENPIKKYIFILVVASLVILSFFIARQFFIAIISAYILAFLIKPVHYLLSKKINYKLAAVLCILIILAVFIIPVSIVLITVLNQINYAINISALSDKISSLPLLSQINVEPLIQQGLSYAFSIIKSTILELPFLAISILIAMFGIYYILINWNLLSLTLKKYLPFKNKDEIASEIANSTKKIVYGYFLIAFIEFIVASIGFSISGVHYALLFAILIAIFAFIPGIGPGAVWLPLSAYNLVTGDYFTAIGVLITGLVISLCIETLLYVKILGKQSQINPLILLVGIFGGVPLFGIFGFVIGPLVLIYTIKLLEEAINSPTS